MAAPSTRFVLLLSCLQVNIIINIDGLTLPLQSLTTKCESYTKKPQKRHETIIGNEKQDFENVSPDFYYSPFLPTDPCISVPSKLSSISKRIDDYTSTNSQEVISNVALLIPKAASSASATVTDDADYMINLLPTPSDKHSNAKTSFSISDSESEIYSELPVYSTNDPKLLKFPKAECNSMTSAVPSCINLQNLFNFEDNRIDFPVSQSNIFTTDSTAPTIAVPLLTPFVDLVSPSDPIFSDSNMLYTTNPYASEPMFSFPISNSITSNIEPINLDLKAFVQCKTEAPTLLDSSSLNLSSVPDTSPLPTLPFDATSFTLPQMIPSFISNQQQFLSPPCNFSPESGAIMPIAKNLLDTPLELTITSHSDLDMSNVSKLPEHLDLLNSKTLLPDSCSKASLNADSVNNIETLNIKRETAEVISTTPSGISTPFECKPWAASSLNIADTQYTKSISPLREFLTTVMPQALLWSGSMTDLPSSSLSLSPLLANDFDQSSNPISDAYAHTSEPLVTSCSNRNLGAIALPSDNIDSNKLPMSSLITFNQISSLSPTVFESSGLTLTELPGSPILNANVLTNECPLGSFNIIPSLPTQNLISIEKYFEDVRAVTAKLNEFIESFSGRSSSSCTLASCLEIMPAPLQPNVIPLYKQVLPEMSTGSSTQIYADNAALAFPSIDQDIAIMAPKVSGTIINTFNYPITSTPVEYNSVPDSTLSSAPYGNCLPSSYTDCLDSYNNSPFFSPFGSLSGSPYTYANPIISSNFPNPTTCTNLDSDFTNSFIPVTLSSVLSKDSNNIGEAFPMQIPYLSSASTNSAQTCDEAMKDFSLNIPSACQFSMNPSPSLQSAPVSSPTSLDGALMNSCCEDLEKMIALLELSMVLNGEADCNINSLSNVISLL